MIMKFDVVYSDEDLSGEESSSVTSDSEYIPPQRLRAGCDDDNYDEGGDIQFEDEFEYDEESACSAHGFDTADRNEDYLVVRLRGGTPIFSMKLKSSEGMIYNDEIDDLPVLILVLV